MTTPFKPRESEYNQDLTHCFIFYFKNLLLLKKSIKWNAVYFKFKVINRTIAYFISHNYFKVEIYRGMKNHYYEGTV